MFAGGAVRPRNAANTEDYRAKRGYTWRSIHLYQQPEEKNSMDGKTKEEEEEKEEQHVEKEEE